MRNTILYSRYKMGLGINYPYDLPNIGKNTQKLQSNKSRVDDYLNEILSRWKIVSPHYCINCLSIMKPDEYRCKKCGTGLSNAEKRIDHVKNKKYNKPVFNLVELKWNSKLTEYYLDSLAPAMGESQFEYRERLKWEFAENNNLKRSILNAIDRNKQEEKKEVERKRQAAEFQKHEKERKRQLIERKKREDEYIRQYGGGYCDLNCRHCYEEFFDSRGGIVGDFDSGGYTEYSCRLGHAVSQGSFCKDYE